jgi:hypothetical protein
MTLSDSGQIVKTRRSHIWRKVDGEHYVEPQWCSTRLFDVESFDGAVLDPCCGWGRVVVAARAHGYQADGADIVDRGFPGTVIENLLSRERPTPNIVTNPPFGSVLRRFVEHAVRVSQRKTAVIFPVARLNAATWLRDLPLARVWLMTPRPSMPPGAYIAAGNKPKGGRVDFGWLVFDRLHRGPPSCVWLRRDRDKDSRHEDLRELPLLVPDGRAVGRLDRG